MEAGGPGSGRWTYRPGRRRSTSARLLMHALGFSGKHDDEAPPALGIGELWCGAASARRGEWNSGTSDQACQRPLATGLGSRDTLKC